MGYLQILQFFIRLLRLIDRLHRLCLKWCFFDGRNIGMIRGYRGRVQDDLMIDLYNCLQV